MAGSPQQHMSQTVGQHTTLPTGNPPCTHSLWEQTRVSEGNHDFWHSVELYSFHMRTGFKSY